MSPKSKKANEIYQGNDRWKKFNIDAIHNFFKEIPITKSEILNSYVEHIKQIHNDLTYVSDKSIREWNFNNFQTYFNKIIKEELSKIRNDFHLESWGYQGKTCSSSFYYHPNESNDRLTKGYLMIIRVLLIPSLNSFIGNIQTQ